MQNYDIELVSVPKPTGMRQWLKKTLLLVAGLFACLNASAYFEVDGIFYNIVDEAKSTCEVTYYRGGDGYSGDVTIPESITWGNKQWQVVRIGNNAFKSNAGLTSVSIPNSATRIRESAFYECSGLKSVTIGNAVTQIDDYAFYRCSSLTSVSIPNSVTKIGMMAFSECGLTSVSIGSAVAQIGSGAFQKCKLATINSLNQTPPKCDGRIFSEDIYGTALLNVPQGSLSAYQSDIWWNEISNIQEMNFSSVGNTINGTITVSIAKGNIVVTGTGSDTPIVVYNSAGQLIYNGKDTIINIHAKGIYIVKIAEQTFKIFM